MPPKTPVSMDSMPKIFLISARLLASGERDHLALAGVVEGNSPLLALTRLEHEGDADAVAHQGLVLDLRGPEFIQGAPVLVQTLETLAGPVVLYMDRLVAGIDEAQGFRRGCPVDEDQPYDPQGGEQDEIADSGGHSRYAIVLGEAEHHADGKDERQDGEDGVA